MTELFSGVLNMSAAACVVIAVVLAARLLLRRAPKKWSYLLWSAVGFRLCCPVSLPSALSVFRLGPLQPSAAAAAADAAVGRTSAITYIPQITVPPAAPVSPVTPAIPVRPVTSVLPAVEEAARQTVSSATPAAQADPAGALLAIAMGAWLAGMAILLGYSVYSYVRMRRLVADAVIIRDNVYETDRIRSPFILGLFRPHIYIPAGMDDQRLSYVLAHEGCHLRRGDHIVKTAAFALLAVHWFNPLVWLAFHLMGRDMEMSCDERVLGAFEGESKAYSATLLSFAAPGRFPAASPLCFGESSVRSRIKNALHWRRPRLWVTLLAAVLCLAAVTACATNPGGIETDRRIAFEKYGDAAVVFVKDGDSAGSDAEGSPSPHFCNAEYTEAIREMVDSRDFAEDPAYRDLPEEIFGPGDICFIVDGEQYYIFLDTGVLLRSDMCRALRKLSGGERKLIQNVLEGRMSRPWVKVTPLDNDVFRLMDDGDTPGLYLTVKLPESWAGRYTYHSGESGVRFYCRETYDETVGSGQPQGFLLGISVVDEFIPPEYPLPDSSRVLAASSDYSVLLLYPSDVQFTPDTQSEYRAMSDDREKVEIELTRWMLDHTYNESSWPQETVVLRALGLQGEHFVICDADASGNIRHILESRTYEEHSDRWQELAESDMEILVNGRWYTLYAPQGSYMETPCIVARNDGRFASENLTEEEVETIRLTLYNDGTMQAVSYEKNEDSYFIHGYGSGLCWTPGDGTLFFRNPKFWGDKYEWLHVEGRASWANREKTSIYMQYVVSNGWMTADGLRGLHVSYTVDLDSGAVVNREVVSERGSTIALTDEEMVENAVRIAPILRAAEADAQRLAPQRSEAELAEHRVRVAETLAIEQAKIRAVTDSGGTGLTYAPGVNGNVDIRGGGVYLSWYDGNLTLLKPAFWGDKFRDQAIAGDVRWADRSRQALAFSLRWGRGEDPFEDEFAAQIEFTVNTQTGAISNKREENQRLEKVNLSDEDMRQIAARTAAVMNQAEAVSRDCRLTVPDRGQTPQEAAWEIFDVQAALYMETGVYPFCRYNVKVSDATTELKRTYRQIDENSWAIDLSKIFTLDYPENLRYYMAGTIGNYGGKDPSVPEGALAHGQVGFITKGADGWTCEIVGTGW